MPSRNSAANPAITRSGSPSRRRPDAVNATWRAESPENGAAVVTCGSSQFSNPPPAAGPGMVMMVNRAYGCPRYPRANRPWMSPRSSRTVTAASQEREPLFGVRGAHLTAQAGPDPGIVLDVVGAERRVGAVPHRHGHLVNAQRVLELLLVLGPTPEHPASWRVAGGVAESGVQAPPDLVDEVVVVGLDRTVVTAGERHPPPAVKRNPAGEVNGLDPRQVVVVVHVPDRVVDGEHHRAQRDKPEHAGPDEADNRERVLRREVLVAGEFVQVLQRRPLGDRLFPLFGQAQQDRPDRQGDRECRQQREEHQRHGYLVDRLADPELQRRRRRRLQRPRQVGAPGYVVPEFTAYVVGGTAVPVALV